MQVAFVHPRYPSAEGTGATYDATQIVSGLAEAGHEVCVYCARDPEGSPVDDRLELRYFGGHSSHPHTPTQQNRDLLARRDELREHDILHSYSMSHIPAVAEIGDGADVGTVVTLNGYGGTCAKNDLLYLDREQCRSKSRLKCFHCLTRTSSRAGNHGYLYQTTGRLLRLRLLNRGERRLDNIDKFQAVSPHVREVYAEFGYNREQIDVVPNILDPRFAVEHETPFHEPYRLLYVGSLTKFKGVDRLVDIIAGVREQTTKDVSLTIAGDGPLTPTLNREVTERGLSDTVELQGFVSNTELPDIYANHDLFIYPGRLDEPFGRVFIESMAAGTPVVSTDVGSVAEILGDAGVVTEQSVAALVDAVLSVLDPETLREQSAVGKERYRRYESTEVIPAFEQLYADIA